MNTYVEHIGAIRTQDLELLDRVRALVDYLPDYLTCHGVCRRLEDAMPTELEWVVGHFATIGFHHSWCRLIGRQHIILDAYPIAVASGPILLAISHSPWRHLYIEDHKVRRLPSFSEGWQPHENTA